MSEYTVQLKWIIESMTADMVGQPIVARIEAAAKKIFDFDYPIWAEDYRPTLERKILMRYFNKEIGLETVGLWKFYLNERLNRIMPYYNDLYKSVVKEYDFTNSIDMTETFSENETENTGDGLTSGRESSTTDNIKNTVEQSENTESNGSVNESGTNNNTHLTSDLPQANYAGVDYGSQMVEDNGTTGNDRTSHDTTDRSANGTQTTDTTGNLTENYKSQRDIERSKGRKYSRTQKGHTIPIQDLILKYRDTLINIDNMIINDLSDLFMTIY